MVKDAPPYPVILFSRAIGTCARYQRGAGDTVTYYDVQFNDLGRQALRLMPLTYISPPYQISLSIDTKLAAAYLIIMPAKNDAAHPLRFGLRCSINWPVLLT